MGMLAAWCLVPSRVPGVAAERARPLGADTCFCRCLDYTLISVSELGIHSGSLFMESR